MMHLAEFRTQISDTFQRRSNFPLRISQRKILLISADVVLINIALMSGFIVNPDVLPLSATIALHPVWFTTLTVLWLVIGSANDNYDIKKAARLRSGVLGILKTLIITGTICCILPILSPPLLRAWPRFLLVGIVATTLLVLWRVFYVLVLASANFRRRALIAGTGLAGRTIAAAIDEHDLGYEIVGYISDERSGQEQDIKDVALINSWPNLVACVQDQRVSDIVLALPEQIRSDQVRAVLACFEQGVRIVPMPELFEEITGRIPVEHIGENWLASLPIGWDCKQLYLLVKRAMDFVLSCIGLLFLLPLVPILGLAIKLDSSGPIFYRPERLGQGGKSFRLWKFRTMVANADSLGDPTFTAKNDHRITKVGRFLRLTHIDELPQFINILLGQMSLVGPRPERYVAELEESSLYYRIRYAVKPGATGWALVNQGYADGLEDTLIKLQYDLYYIKHQSLTLDIAILCKSVIHMLTMGGR